MTDQALKEIVNGLVVSTAELRSGLEETRKAQEETRKALQEWIEAQERAREEERKAREEERKARGEEERKAREEELKAEERSRVKREAEHKETERVVRQVTKQLGELGNKMGSFAEGMALPSMEKLLYREFGMNVVLPYAKSRRKGESLEIDVLAYDNGEKNEAVIVEVKSHLTSEGVQQILKTIEDFPKFFPSLSDRKIFGILAGVKIPDSVRSEVLKNGLYLARISDDTFKLQVPSGFKPKAFNVNGSDGRKKNGAKPKRGRAKK